MHEDALETVFGAVPDHLVSDGGIKALILGHRLMGIQTNLAIAAPHRFRLREREQPPAQTRALPARSDGYIVEQEILRPRQQDDDASYDGFFRDHPYDTLRDACSVVVEHRPRLLSDAGDVMPISLLDDFPDRQHIGGARGSDARFIHVG